MTGRLLLAEFDTADGLVAAARSAARFDGVSRLETYSPFPLEAIHDIVGEPASNVRTVMVVAAIVGGLAAFGLQTYSAVIAYPFDSGGRPLFAWPAFMLVTFEMTVLFAALGGFVAMLWRNGLPRLHHPVFDWHGIERASNDRFFLEVAIEGEAGVTLSDELRLMGARSLQDRAP